MTYISSSLVLTLQRIRENAGKLCYRNIVAPETISATSSRFRFPATNMANPATAFGWEAADTATQTITIDNPSGATIDYLGIARHNLDQQGLTLEVRFNGVTVQAPSPVDPKQALLFLFAEATPTTIEIIISGATSPPKIAVIYAGQSVTLQRNIYVGHTPINYGRDRKMVNGVSQSGEYLGTVELNQTLSTSVELRHLTPDWYRDTLDPFIGQTPRRPCFWAWRPEKYPGEIGYCWIDGDPRPVNQLSNGMMSISWNFVGIQ